MAKKSTEVAKKEAAGALALYEGYEGTGFEDTSSEDYALPFLKLLQKNSPEVDPDDGAYVQGAQAGKFLDTSTGEIYDEVQVIPCLYKRAMVEWRDRDAGGGWVAQHEPGTEQQYKQDDRGRWWTGDETYLADTRYFFCLQITEDGGTKPVVLGLSSTQLKKARSWMTRMQNLKVPGPEGRRITPPMFSHVWRLTSAAESNEHGSWKGYKIDMVGPVEEEELAQAAIDAYHTFKQVAGNVKPPETAEATADDKVPF